MLTNLIKFSKYKTTLFPNGEFTTGRGFSNTSNNLSYINSSNKTTSNPYDTKALSNNSNKRTRKNRGINKRSSKTNRLLRNYLLAFKNPKLAVTTILTLPNLTLKELVIVYKNAATLISQFIQSLKRLLFKLGLNPEVVVVRELLTRKTSRLHWHLVFQGRTNNAQQESLVSYSDILTIWRRLIKNLLSRYALTKTSKQQLHNSLTTMKDDFTVQPVRNIEKLSSYLTKQPTNLDRSKFELPEDIECLSGRSYNVTNSLRGRVREETFIDDTGLVAELIHQHKRQLPMSYLYEIKQDNILLGFAGRFKDDIGVVMNSLDNLMRNCPRSVEFRHKTLQ